MALQAAALQVALQVEGEATTRRAAALPDFQAVPGLLAAGPEGEVQAELRTARIQMTIRASSGHRCWTASKVAAIVRYERCLAISSCLKVRG
ncbi:hypothetical protein RvVAR031_05380 [Agrobacterium vitis]|nr:hypothetical protein RvVAR031_05380 [Agrobacterium vitis]